ncbi:GSU2403 family nucleotidyltransferase fold protein [Polynucleobacter sp. AP-Nino-20-G2]|uniref:GSU2403 family nucleotidyltransferase fold protein n=1 Tax=Polynucleobacter sp. AP-Nino-20-G2 TaxID=2576917 RepID=UPI001BFD7D59|nr:GSU2403 family nucleotidyltransferase fold protein [Polynucleobacter sp. AP-Nino-20-G2]QWE16905.1 hypothetical protein FD960_01375 [Polynucleobacter sp. AP-Nino-20-G2]
MSSPEYFLKISESQSRQYIDAETVFLALREAVASAAEVRGSMIWRELRGVKYLIRTSASSAQRTIGRFSPETQSIYDNFMARKRSLEARVSGLKGQLKLQQRLNRAQRVGRVPNLLVELLNVLEKAGVAEHFLVVGTHAIYAYEAAGGVRVSEGAMATRDVDLLFDTRKRLAFFSTIKSEGYSLLGLIRKVDSSFELVSDRLYTARNNDGFEIDIIRRPALEIDPHPLRMSEDEGDLWAMQVSMGEKLISSRYFKQMIVSSSGEMALMRTIHPADFARIKLELSKQPGRDPNKSGKDFLQAKIIKALIHEYLPHLNNISR